MSMSGVFARPLAMGGCCGASFDPVPVADFSGDPVVGVAPLAVQFTDLSTHNPTFWLWDFGDGETSAAQNPLHTYAAADTYTVTVTATNGDGSDSEVKAAYITAAGA